MYPEDTTNVPGRAVVEVIIFLKVLSCWRQRAVGNRILVTAMR